MKKAYSSKKRNTGNRKRKRFVLIAVEGNNKTETNYFKGFNSGDVKILFANGNQTDPINIAKNLVEGYADYGLDAGLGDYAFCVVDGDLSRERADQICKAEKIVKDINGEVIVSNPCVEVWFLCHYVDSTRQYTSSLDVIKRLQEFIPTYKKNMSGIKEFLEDKNEKAIINARHLDEYNQSLGRKLHQYDYQPSTEVYKIIEKL